MNPSPSHFSIYPVSQSVPTYPASSVSCKAKEKPTAPGLRNGAGQNASFSNLPVYIFGLMRSPAEAHPLGKARPSR